MNNDNTSQGQNELPEYDAHEQRADQDLDTRSPKTEISIQRQARKKQLRHQVIAELKGDVAEHGSHERQSSAALDAAAQRPNWGAQQQESTRDVLVGFSYLRVSTKEQARVGGGAEGYSIPAQRSACHTKAQQLGAVIKREYVDAGESQDRPPRQKS